MKPFGTISTTALFLLLGLAVPAHARQEKQEDKAGPPRQEQQAKPQKQEQAKPEKQAQAKPQQQQKEQQQAAKSEKQQQQQTLQQNKGQQRQQQEQVKSDKQQQQHAQQQAKGPRQQQQTASSHGGPQRTQQAMATQRAQPELRLSSRGSGRIPDDRFRSQFGRGHDFHMGNPVMVGGYSRFQYGGYWFGFVDPWPVGWYYSDDFYIDYVDGEYYMYNPYYPGARFALTVVI